MRHSPLAEPGILLRMIAPEPAAVAAPSPRTVARPGGVAWAAAVLAGAAVVVAIRAAAACERVDLPFGRHGLFGWWACGIVGLLAAVVVRRLPGAAVRFGWVRYGWAAPGAGLALVAAAFALGLPTEAPGALAAVWLLLAGLLGALLGGLARAARPHRLLGIGGGGAAAAFGTAWFAVASEPAVFGCAGLVLAVVALQSLRPGSERPADVLAARGRGRWVRAVALVGSVLLLGHALATVAPAAWPGGVALTAAAVAITAVVWPLPAWALLASAVAAAFAPWSLAAPDFAGIERLVASAGEAKVTYLRSAQELRLRVDEQLVDAVGPERGEAPLAATLVHALTQPGDRVLVLGMGAGRVVQHLAEVAERGLDVVDWRPSAGPLRRLLAADGPVVAPAETTARRAVPTPRIGGAAAALAALPAAARQAIVLAEPLATDGPGTDLAIQAELARVTAGGPVLQVVALDRTPAPALHALFSAAAATHRWNGLFVVGEAAVLVSATAPFAADRVVPLADWGSAARWLAHEAHLGSTADLQRALLGTLPAAPPAGAVAATGVGRAAALAVLHAWLQPNPEPAAVGGAPGLLARWTAVQAELRAAAAKLRALPDDATGRAAAQALAARFLHLGAPRPELQAALGLPTADGVTLCAPAAASRRALALDPTFFRTPPAVCATLPMPVAEAGELEDLAWLPAPARLVEVASGDEPLAVALRARFPSRCARAFVAALAEAPLPPAASQALRELADPFVLREAAMVLVPRGRVRELLGLWRGDLAMPAELELLVRSGHEDRRALAAALRSRRDATCHAVLADLLEAPERDVRQLAAQALEQLLPARIPYDPDGPQSARHEAAQRLRSLHNRHP